MARRRRSYPEPEVWNDPRLVWVEGLTERGAPTGVAEEAWASPRGNANRPGWARAQEVLRTAFAKLAPGAQLELGRVRAVASGMSRETYGAFAEPQPDPDGLAGGYVVRLPRPGTGEELQRRSYAEARLLWRLASLELPFEIPVTLAVVPDPHGPAMVQRAIDGFPLRMSEGTLDVVGQVAARVHAIPTTEIDGIVPCSYGSARAHAEAMLSLLEGADDPHLREALAWGRAHLPAPEVAARTLHGDLLPQNILLPLEGDAPALLDWECAVVGDPAHDLAVVTRGVRHPLKVEGGLERLVEVYLEAGGAEWVTPDAVRVHELAMVGSWHRGALEGEPGLHPGTTLPRLRALLSRLA